MTSLKSALTSISGTWKSAPGEVEHAVEFALKNGYKHIDTATAYSNEAEVGKGIKASGVPRESFFLTTKLANNYHTRVEEALEYSLKQLDTDYLDLCVSSVLFIPDLRSANAISLGLMHWPAPMLEDYSGPAKSVRPAFFLSYIVKSVDLILFLHLLG